MEDELKKLLGQVSDTYPDFELAVWISVKNNEKQLKQMVEFLRENPQASTSEVLRENDRVIGIKTFAELEAEQNSNN